jgi:hypothetical protein
VTVPSESPADTGHNPTQDQSTPLARPKRHRRRAKADRGLPPDQELFRLATEYLQIQRKHWPKLVKAGLLPDVEADVVAAMVEDFKHRHRTGQVDPAPLRAFLKHCPKLGGGYNRYSCDNSSRKSIIDQMVNGLDKARQEERFVPWQYVFADYSVSGLNPSRQGYCSYKGVLQDKDHLIGTTYVDDFTRPSRDEIEWWRLAYLSRRLQRRMIRRRSAGVSRRPGRLFGLVVTATQSNRRLTVGKQSPWSRRLRTLPALSAGGTMARGVPYIGRSPWARTRGRSSLSITTTARATGGQKSFRGEQAAAEAEAFIEQLKADAKVRRVWLSRKDGNAWAYTIRALQRNEQGKWPRER